MGMIQRSIRSFVCRKGRLSDSTHDQWARLWPQYGIESSTLDWEIIFGRQAPTVLEIGFGNGQSLLEMAMNSPEKNFVGIEVYHKGLCRLLAQVEQRGLSNVRVMCGDAAELIHQVPLASLSTVQIFFPDPWPKKRHHKRRLIQEAFVSLVTKKLEKNGTIHLATDWMDYAYHMMTVLSSSTRLSNLAGEHCFMERPESRPITKYEQRGWRLGHSSWDLIFQRIK